MHPQLQMMLAYFRFFLWTFQETPPYDGLTLVIGLVLITLLVGVFIGIWVANTVNRSKLSNRTLKALRGQTDGVVLAERERMHKIFNQISALTASLNYQRILENALDLSSVILAHPNQGAEQNMVSGALLFTHQQTGKPQLVFGSARRLTPSDTRLILPGREGVIGETIDSGEAVVTTNLPADPELCRVVGLRAVHSACCVPLKAGLDTYGVLVFGHPEIDFFTQDRREILKLLGNQAAIAVTNARLYHQLEVEKERIQEVQDDTRKKLARDLHDGPTQSIAAIAMRVNFARRLLERDHHATADELHKIEDLARRTTKEIRHMLFILRPLVLESQGLVAALEANAEKMKETYDQTVIIDADQSVIEEMEMGKQTVVFYIAEEAMNNARKHAEAEHIWVRLKRLEPDLAVLEVEDDGAGFNVNAVDSEYDSGDSLGMVNMRERAELVNGVLQIDSESERGTHVRVIIPLTTDAADRLRSGQ